MWLCPYLGFFSTVASALKLTAARWRLTFFDRAASSWNDCQKSTRSARRSSAFHCFSNVFSDAN